MSTQESFANALHQAGRRAGAATRFREAEQMQTEFQPAYPLLYSLSGFRHCDLLLAPPERATWQGQGSLERGVRHEKMKYPWESPAVDLADAKRAILGS